MLFCIWFLLFSMCLRIIHVVPHVNTPFLLWLNNIPMYGWITFFYQSAYWWNFAFSLLLLLWIMLLSTLLYKCLIKHVFSILLGSYLEVELLVHMVTFCLTFWGSTKLFSKVSASLYVPTSSVWGSVTSLPLLVIFWFGVWFCFLIINILVGVRWYDISL